MSVFGYTPYDPECAWWDRELDDPEMARSVLETVMDIERRQVSIHEGNKRHARIYSGYLPSGLASGTAPQSNMRAPFEATKSVVRSVCDTAHSMIVRTRPKASFVTDGGDWQVQQQAEDMDVFMVGAYQSSGLYQVAPRCFHDSTVFGTGGWKYVSRGTGEDFRVYTERVIMDDVVVDEEECRENLEHPPNVYHRLLVRTDALMRKYANGKDKAAGELRAKLLANSGSRTFAWPGLHVPKDRSVLVEAIHVCEEDASKNMRVLAADGVVLKAEKWPYPFQPFTFLWWCLPITGFYGDGIAYRQYGRQQRVTYMHRWIQKCLDLFATPTAWLDPVGGPPTLQMSNDIGKIVMARRPPTFQQHQVVPPEIYNWLDRLERDGYEDEGISQVTAANVLPPGLESAPAQREYSYKEGQRFAPVSQRWEWAMGVDTAYKMAAMYKRHADKGQGAKVRWADRKLMYTIEWPDLQDEVYMIRPEASSLDSLSPAARTQAALELAQTGWIKPEEGRALIAHPDLRESEELDTSPVTYAKWVLRQLRKGKPIMVDEKSEMGIVMEIVKKGRLLYIQKNCPDEIVNNIDRYIESLDAEMKRAADAAMAQQQAQMMAMQQPTPGISEASAGGMPAPFPA